MSERRPRPLLFVTGMSGAGKSTVLKVLEDAGWETVDNVPMGLLEDLIARTEDQVAPLAIGISSRTRDLDPERFVARWWGEAARPHEATLLFLDCKAREIERRYNETRRRHPLALDRPVAEGIADERVLLEPVRRTAELVVDTSRLAANELQQAIRARFADTASGAMTLTVTSFGFSRGMPPMADLLFDMRYLDNPHYVPALRELTGKDAEVAAHIEADPAFAPSFEAIRDCVLELLPRYEAQGRAYLTIAFGCTGGRHRSVYTAERMAEVLREAGRHPTVLHRTLRRAREDDPASGDTPSPGAA